MELTIGTILGGALAIAIMISPIALLVGVIVMNNKTKEAVK